MNYSKMSDFQINEEVAKTEGLKIHHDQSRFVTLRDDAVIAQDWLTGRFVEFDYCNNPSDAWPVMLRACISINYDTAQVHAESYFNPSVGKVSLPHSKALRAAMIVFLKARAPIRRGRLK